MKANQNKHIRMCLIIMLSFMTACTSTNQPDATPATATSTAIQQTMPSQPTSTSIAATITPLPTRITPTVYPPDAPPPDWITYVHPQLNIAVQYPPDW